MSSATRCGYCNQVVTTEGTGIADDDPFCQCPLDKAVMQYLEMLDHHVGVNTLARERVTDGLIDVLQDQFSATKGEATIWVERFKKWKATNGKQLNLLDILEGVARDADGKPTHGYGEVIRNEDGEYTTY